MTDDNYEIPDEDKIEISKEFLRYAPPGEFNQVFNNVSVVLDKKLENCEGVPATALDYHQDQLTTVFLNVEKQQKYQLWLNLRNLGNNARLKALMGNCTDFLDDNGEAMISAQSHISGNTFFDIKRNVLFDFDPITQNVSNLITAPSNLRPLPAEPLRKTLESEVDKYVKQHYPKGVCAVYTRYDSDVEDCREYVILIEDHEFQPQNRWNGKWRSEWCATCSDSGQIQIQGGAKVHVHYYEDSNVQLVTKQLYEGMAIDGITSKDTDSNISSGIVRIIKKLETRYQQSLRDNYVTMDDTTFKTLRRKLPVSKVKFNWENIAAQKIGKEIAKEQE